MRKVVLSVALVLLSGLPAYAQGASGGVKVGINFANVEFDPDPPEDVDFKTLTGFAAGGYVTLPLGPVFAIQPEALFIQKGTKLENGGDIKFKLTYLEIPVLARIGTDAFNVFGGPSFAFKLDSEVEIEGEDDDLEISQDFDENLKGNDFGIVAGVGFGSSRFNVDVRFTWGLTDINDDPDDVVEVRNRSIGVMFGIKIGG
jgi:Outer membrane protein beta-barrel domain